MNPVLQGKTYDADASYIKEWVPELKDVTPKQIHGCTWDARVQNYQHPIIDQKVASKRAVDTWKKAAHAL